MKDALRSARTILLRAPNWVGDIVMATPFFAAVRRSCPAARVVVAVRQYATGILADAPWFDAVLGIQDRGLGGFRATVAAFRQVRPDVAVVLPNSWRATLSCWLSGARRLYGYRRAGRGLLLTGGPVPVRDAAGGIVPRPMIEYYLELARWLELDLPAAPKPELHLSPAAAAAGAQRLAAYGLAPGERVIGLNPGAKFGTSKCWPVAHFAALAELLQREFAAKLLLLVGPGEEALAAAIVAQSRATLINTAADRIDLAQLKPLVQRCNLLITNDTGPRHYAVAFGVPVVVLMGPTDRRYTDANLERTIVVRQDLPCAPCHQKVCPRDHECLTRITPALVLAAARELLARGPNR